MKGSSGALQGRQGQRQLAYLNPWTNEPHEEGHSPSEVVPGAVLSRRRWDIAAFIASDAPLEPPIPFGTALHPPELPRRDVFPWGPDPALTWRGQGFAVRQRPALRGPSGTPGKTSIFFFPYPGRAERTRTSDLCQLPLASFPSKRSTGAFRYPGRGGGDRTRDFSPPRRARYRCATPRSG